ncbi:hypothetical protein [uncultured Hyphomonas sp.]|uniref:hypothetical protein n=1 Tax=uncultured Hyphomonas sp. TaxID=225298 RepID=UPI000C5C210E|nr:hypothetical protein [Hyphomonadaceae bacterium]MBA30095.1 hypothetical protein [Hyphomonadaceae bacterium]QDP63721.1 MAG: hypothetical protein GOVbin258_49 [Prokaryotic dsDNA virus sp.]|tara:strand:- start:17532 stop:17957 length:426 start_codon:yes stop_codon:yes gene_type:complete
MAEDWASIAAEVEDAIRSVSDTSQPNGFPATIRKAGTTAGANPWDPATGTPTYHTVWIVDGDRVIRDETGTRIERIERTLMVSATGTAIEDEDMIAVGIAAEDASEATQWETIKEVRPVAPAGVVVYYSLVIDGAPGKLST